LQKQNIIVARNWSYLRAENWGGGGGESEKVCLKSGMMRKVSSEESDSMKKGSLFMLGPDAYWRVSGSSIVVPNHGRFVISLPKPPT